MVARRAGLLERASSTEATISPWCGGAAAAVRPLYDTKVPPIVRMPAKMPTSVWTVESRWCRRVVIHAGGASGAAGGDGGAVVSSSAMPRHFARIAPEPGSR